MQHDEVERSVRTVLPLALARVNDTTRFDFLDTPRDAREAIVASLLDAIVGLSLLVSVVEGAE